MKKRYDKGGEIDAMEEANNRSEMTPRRVSLPPRALKEMGDASAAEEAGQFGDAGSSRTVKATPKPAAKPAAKPAVRDTGSDVARMANRGKPAAAADDTKMSVADRAKASRERARAGSGTTDRRSVGERLKSAFGMKSGGSVSSASKRADGCATKGKTRGKYI